MLQVRRHVDPGSGLSLLHVVAESHARLALHEEEHGRLRRRVFGKFLALAEAEDHRLDPIVLEDRAAQDAVRRRFGLLGEIEDVGVRVVMVVVASLIGLDKWVELGVRPPIVRYGFARLKDRDLWSE